MVTIAELPNDPRYTIKTVCAQTGIRAVTLRAWERRYRLLSPQRGDNKYRLYSDQDVALLRWIKSRVDMGITISLAVRELHAMQANGSLPEPIPIETQQNAPWARPPQEYSDELYSALIHHSESAAGDKLREAQSLFDLSTFCLEVIVPCLVRIGDAWERGEIRIATEHFASAYIRGKLMGLLTSFPMRRGMPYILSGCPSEEYHEIGSLILALLLRREGFRVEYLGPDLPLPDLVEYARFEKPRLIVLSVTLREHIPSLRNFAKELSTVYPTPLFGFGGRAFNTAPPALRESVPGIWLGQTLSGAVVKIKDLFDIPTR
jgi:DNA-binding transcriptional MerR regulator